MLERIGQMLREAREAKGLSLTDIQMETNIRLSYLQALEAGAGHDAFPGSPYHRGFLKTYARLVGLSPEEILKLYDEHYGQRESKADAGTGSGKAAPPAAEATAPTPAPTPASAPTTPAAAAAPAPAGRPAAHAPKGALIRGPEPSRPRGARGPGRSRGQGPGDSGRRTFLTIALLVILILAVVGAAWWFLGPGATAVTPMNGSGTPVAGNTGGNTGGAAATSGSAGASTQPPAAPAVTVTKRNVDKDNAVFDVQGADKVTVVVKATERCWFGVTQDGKLIAEETLEPGDSRSWSADGKLELRVGNPGGATMVVNGQDKGVMGEQGMPKSIVIQKVSATTP